MYNLEKEIPMIKITNLSKSYNQVKAIDQVSFELKPGEILGFIGPNGAGKSTTIKTLLNYIYPDSGSATINGLNIFTESKKIKQTLSYVSSEVNFYPDLSIEETIQLSLDIHNIKDHTYRDELFKLFQVESHKKIKELSLGNKKKVSLVAALVVKPQIIIMDEPTNGLDPLIQKKLFNLLKELASQGCSILVSSHNMNEIQEHCDRVVFIKSGKIIDTIIVKDISLNGKYIKVKGDIESLVPMAQEILNKTETSISMIYAQSLNSLLQHLSTLNIDDLSIEDVSMEHRYLKYYQEDTDHD